MVSPHEAFDNYKWHIAVPYKNNIVHSLTIFNALEVHIKCAFDVIVLILFEDILSNKLLSLKHHG